MGCFVPVLLAYILNLAGLYIFTEVKSAGTGPYVSLLIFTFAMFILFWDIRLYPASLRKLGPYLTQVMEFFIACFLMEHIVNDFWIPLEEAAIAFLPKLAEYEEYILKQSGFNSDVVTGFLKDEQICMCMSYVLSLFFFIGVLHATRIVDLRLLKCGVGAFVNDITDRITMFYCKLRATLFGETRGEFDDIYDLIAKDPEFNEDFKNYRGEQETDSDEGDNPRGKRRRARRQIVNDSISM